MSVTNEIGRILFTKPPVLGRSEWRLGEEADLFRSETLEGSWLCDGKVRASPEHQSSAQPARHHSSCWSGAASCCRPAACLPDIYSTRGCGGCVQWFRSRCLETSTRAWDSYPEPSSCTFIVELTSHSFLHFIPSLLQSVNHFYSLLLSSLVLCQQDRPHRWRHWDLCWNVIYGK